MPQQLYLFKEYSSPLPPKQKVVNVSSVPQRSPFRYAGGKTWLIPTIRRWLPVNSQVNLIEPFCGGGIVSLTAVAENRVKKATMIEKDEDVAAAWITIFKHNDWLIDRIMHFELTTENVYEVISKKYTSVQEHGFQTIIRNRTNHGGILAKGAGSIKNGENGKGIGSRWYPKTLSKRIKDISSYMQNIKFVQGDAFDYI